MSLGDIEAIRCDHDGLKMAEVLDGHLILRKKHHDQTHVKIVSLCGLRRNAAATPQVTDEESENAPTPRRPGVKPSTRRLKRLL